MSTAQTPRRGDIVWLDFTPQTGREQAGRRTAVILSHDSYNRKTCLAIACPITSHSKGYPFEVSLPPGGLVAGVVLSDHVRSIDWRARNASRVDRLEPSVLDEIVGKLAAFVTDAA